MKISIVTLTNNSDKNIQRCIDSIKNQTYKNVEHIIIDNLSTDNTIQIAKSNTDYNQKFISENDKGIYDGWNKGFKMCSGDIIGTVMSDDFLKNDYVLEKIVECFENSNADIVYGDLDFESEGKIIRKWEAGYFNTFKFYLGWMPPAPSVYQKKHVIEKNNLFDLEFQISADYEFYLRLFFIKNYNIKYLNICFYTLEYGGISNKSVKNILKANIECYKSWRKNNLFQLPLIILTKPLLKVFQFKSLKFVLKQYFIPKKTSV